MKQLFVILLLCAKCGIHSISAAEPSQKSTEDETSAIRTPKYESPAPRINGPRVYGARPNRPFQYYIPVVGQRPITYGAEGLPSGLTLDKTTGIITGRVAQAGEYPVKLTATNAAGSTSAPLKIKIGSRICLTPPMGWNNWNNYHMGINDANIRETAEAMISSGLIDHGYCYINLDEGWDGTRDEKGALRMNPKKFKDPKALGDFLHTRGLKFGIYSSPGPKACAGTIGSYEYEDIDAATYASWGVDFLKYDWCSYEHIEVIRRAELLAKALPDKSNELLTLAAEYKDLAWKELNMTPGKKPEDKARIKEISTQINGILATLDKETQKKIRVTVAQEPYQRMRASLDKVDRDIVYSICQYGKEDSWEWADSIGANLARTTPDLFAKPDRMDQYGFGRPLKIAQWQGPGHWNDPDMLQIGNGNFTTDQNYTHMTQWCMLGAPLILGNYLTKLTPFLLNVFTNDEVLAVNQDELGLQATQVSKNGKTEVWAKPLADGGLAVALYNRSDAPAEVAASWTDLKLNGKRMVRDLWRQKDLAPTDLEIKQTVAPYGAEMFKILPNSEKQ